MPLSAADSLPTSVRSEPSGTRCERSPAAIARAVCSTSVSGRRLLRTSPYPAAASATRTIRPTTTSMVTSRLIAAWSWARSAPMTTV